MNRSISVRVCVCVRASDRKRERERQSVQTMSGQVNGERGAPLSAHQMWRNVSPLWGWVSEWSWHATIDGWREKRERVRLILAHIYSSCAAGKMQREGRNIVLVSSMRWVRGFVVPHFLSRWSMAFCSTTAPSMWANKQAAHRYFVFKICIPIFPSSK